MLKLLHLDDDLVAIDKPPGLLVHRSMLDRHETRFAVQLLRDQIGRRVIPVHRLDKGTSGVLVFAFERETAAALAAQFETRAVEKRYLAVVRGWPAESGVIEHPLKILRDEYELPIDGLAPPQEARTAFRRLATIELPVPDDRHPTSRYAWLELAPETGRRHQIRRHLKHISHPVIGDATYGKGRHNRMFADQLGCARLLLHCAAMTLQHPRSGQPLALRAKVSGDYQRLLERFGWDREQAQVAGTLSGPESP
ncbi:pseudouridine synthase [Niveibacterium microcysteis]|uniref:tRNA pseudouridine synthase C n=1 Tax=Niveibacterium microcysteis TaxID=2811415 RepID=A0ABX7MB39_9RHOO|nr:pseudouridine synthase [Niveibacterium microcysteis]QSI78911.1 pseudouridylate synthase [Niveibacterium microcysteis]